MTDPRGAAHPPPRPLPREFTHESAMTAPAEADVDLGKLAAAWAVQARDHRAAQKVYGKVSTAVIDTPTGSETHLTEETTFKAAKGQPCPLTQATNWMLARMAQRKAAGDTGGVRLELEQKAGEVTWAKVIETTIIQARAIDGTRKNK